VPWNPITTYKDGKLFSKASDERVTRAEALHYSSWGGAYAEFAESFKGSLEKGKLADFVVIDRDYFDENATKDSDIKDINALMTVVGGEICYTMEAPTVVTDEVGDAKVGAPYAFTATGNTDTSPTLNWSITDRDAALKWLKVDYHSGALSGTPTKAGTYEFDVTAKNYLGSATRTLTIIVNPKDVPVKPVQIGSSTVTVAKIADTAYKGSQIKPTVAISENGAKLVSGTDYTVAYGANKAVGKGSITITGKGKYTGTRTAQFNIVPNKVAKPSVKASSGSLKATWKKLSTAQVTKYQLQYRVSGAAKWTTKTVAASSSSLTIKSLKKGKTYEVRIRAYKTTSLKANYYGAWSSVAKSAKIK
jgi:hypothetical protein